MDSCSYDPRLDVRPEPRDPTAFFQGKIGVVDETWDPIYLATTFAMFNGRRFNDTDARSIVESRSEGTSVRFSSPGDVWERARTRFPGAPPSIDAYKSLSQKGEILYFRNCLSAAFETAAEVIEERESRWGSGSQTFREWLAGQDQVFQNCGGLKSVIPKEVPANSDPVLIADRQYQIGAAYFYAGEWSKARAQFAKVAANQNSGWQPYGRYMMARTDLRQGTLDGDEQALARAAAGFDKIGPGDEEFLKPSSLGLAQFVRIRTGDEVKRLSDEIAGKRPSRDLQVSAGDFNYLAKMSSSTVFRGKSEMADWVTRMHARHPPEDGYSYGMWKKTRSKAWLVAALRTSNQEQLLDLIDAAKAIKPTEPAYESAVYLGLAADVRLGRLDDFRSWSAQTLKQALVYSTRNMILSLSLMQSRSWEEFLQFAPRTPEPPLGFQVCDNTCLTGSNRAWAEGRLSIGADALFIIENNVPLNLYLVAMDNNRLDVAYRSAFAQKGFARALILGRNDLAKTFLQRYIALHPEQASAAAEVLSARDDAAMRFASMLLMMRSSAPDPQFKFSGAVDFRLKDEGRLTWASDTTQGAASEIPVFLSEPQRQAAKAETEQIFKDHTCGPNWAEEEAMSWVRSHADDPRSPEALHLVVHTTAHSCRFEPSNAKLSKEAFDLLHQRYPNSEWTKKTPYWYR